MKKRVFFTFLWTTLFDMKSGKTKNELSEVGKRIAQARRKLGLTQVELAKELGVSQQVITFWEREAPAPRAEMLAQLTQILGVSSDELLGIGDQAKRRGPTSRLETCFERVAGLPRRKREQIIGVVETLLQQ